MSVDLNNFLRGNAPSSLHIDFRPLVADLIKAGTNALNTYAENKGRPTLHYNVSTSGWNVGRQDVEDAFQAWEPYESTQKGSD